MTYAVSMFLHKFMSKPGNKKHVTQSSNSSRDENVVQPNICRHDPELWDVHERVARLTQPNNITTYFKRKTDANWIINGSEPSFES